MKVAIYGKPFTKDFYKCFIDFFSLLNKHKIKIVIYEPLYNFLIKNVKYSPHVEDTFIDHKKITTDIKAVFSIGGDGTFLETVTLIRNKEIPIIGINSGRMGFLATISKEDLIPFVDAFINKNYIIETRSLLEVNKNLFPSFNYALNEIGVYKKESVSMITIHAYLNNEFLNSYWADGLLVATPTGSTAYSLSAGGPIVSPDAKTFILSPIASHNLTVRPLIVPDSYIIKLKIEGRANNFLLSLDHRSETIPIRNEITIKKSKFSIKMLKFKNHDFFNTLRNKLMWGIDKRN